MLLASLSTKIPSVDAAGIAANKDANKNAKC
jgi:hypothetical protein